MSTALQLPSAARIAYRVERHPLTILAGYFTIFFLSVSVLPLTIASMIGSYLFFALPGPINR